MARNIKNAKKYEITCFVLLLIEKYQTKTEI